jgi:hypothetical protein
MGRLVSRIEMHRALVEIYSQIFCMGGITRIFRPYIVHHLTPVRVRRSDLARMVQAEAW